MVLIDSDVLLLAFAYPNDDRQKVNQKFLEAVQTAQPATTIYNVMETLGQLSFNLSAEQLDGWQDWLANAYNLTIIWDADTKEKVDPETWREIIYERPFQKMQTVRMACAESAKADVFLSTDDRLLKLAKRNSKKLDVRVENPLIWVEEMI